MKYILPLSVLVPIAFVLEFGHIGGPTAVFAASALSLIPLAGLWVVPSRKLRSSAGRELVHFSKRRRGPNSSIPGLLEQTPR